jgi:hypothetical protein
MRLWSVHPSLLDPKGLVALWREGLLAQKVLQGRTTGYRSHPQLHRFRQSGEPLAAIATYLWAVHDAACLGSVPAQAKPDEIPWVRVAKDKKGFVLDPSGRPFVPWGLNYDHDDKGG